jgi:alpha-galactosidase
LPSLHSLFALVALLLAGTTSGSARAQNATVTTPTGSITIQGHAVTVTYHQRTGTLDLLWRDGHQLRGIASAAQLADGRALLTTGYTRHDLLTGGEQSSGSKGTTTREYTIRSSGAGLPDLFQHIWIYGGKPWISIQAELDSEASAVGTRHFDAVVVRQPHAVQLGQGAELRFLHVPFDNDMWFRYSAIALSNMDQGRTWSSNEVTAIFDNATRQALVLGSITHNVWKTAIDIRVAGGELTDLDIYGGISSPTGVRTDTHDTVPHGIVHGKHVQSPRIFIGSFSDWRDGLEAFGQANAEIHPPLRWPQGPPLGWNSWAAYADHVSYQRYLGAARYLRDVLVPEGFGSHHMVYLNLDAFWSRLDAVQLANAVAIIKGMRSANGTQFEPGIYWTPFAYWSDDLDAFVEGTNMKYRYRDILLKAPDGSFLPKVDGGRAIDPTAPGAKERIAYFMQEFLKLGFTYIKLDFLSHGALEGVHADPEIQTGIEAYNVGMDQIVKAAAGRMFLSLSIAPLFPSGDGHARRISCDTKGHISGENQSTEYMLNSLTFGWWTSPSLYIADPDAVVLGPKADQGARSVMEGKSRLLSAVISGGMILDSSRLADDPQGEEFAKEVYDNRNLFAIASEGKVFRPVEGDSGDRAATAFVRASERGYDLAVFNYDDKQPQTITLPLRRIDPSLAATDVAVIDVANGKPDGSVRGAITVPLPPAGSKLLELRPQK